MRYLSVSSDPRLFEFRFKFIKKPKELHEEAKELLNLDTNIDFELCDSSLQD